MACLPRSPLGFVVLLLALPFAGVAAGQPVQPSEREQLTALAAGAQRELRGDILPFWLKHAPNPANGGFVGSIDQEMKVDAGAPRGELLCSRILWTFSAAYERYPQPEYLEMARRAYADLVGHFRDRKHGGMLWTISAAGKPLDDRKLIYGQVFAIYALAEYHRATGDAAALEEAKALFALVDEKAHDPVHGGYFDVLKADWSRPDGVQLNFLGPAPKTQNSHIHILEAFTNLLREWPDARLKARERELIELLLGRIIAPNHHLLLYLRDDWTPLSDEVSYGHDIELSWLLTEAADVLGDAGLRARCRAEALRIADVTLAQGVDADGAVFNGGTPHAVTDRNKDWWPQAEGAVGFLNAYQLSGDVRYLAAAGKVWSFIQAKLVDRKNGGWYESLDAEGRPRRGMKLSVWKCPYHNSRSCLELVTRIGALEKAPAASR